MSSCELNPKRIVVKLLWREIGEVVGVETQCQSHENNDGEGYKSDAVVNGCEKRKQE